MLVYQIVSSYPLTNHNVSSLLIIKKMVMVIVAILRTKTKKEGRFLLKKIRGNLNEILKKFCTVTVKKCLRQAVEDITELIIDFFKEYDKQ